MYSTLFSAALVVALAIPAHVIALPAVLETRADAVDDTTVLNYALTLEHLESAFYNGALDKFDEKAFADAGLPWFARGRFVQIAAHEKAHVDFLTKALGDKATAACTYSFPYTDPKSFAALSQVLEGVGTSAYLGAAQFITNKSYLTAAASILTTEARHAGWVASAVNKFAAWSGPLDVPLGLNEVFTLAAPFITSCPSTNPALPVKAFPALSLANPAPGASASVTHKSTTGTPTHIVFFTGLDQIFVEIKDGKVAVPEGLSGQVYAVATTSGTDASDAAIVAGPEILLFERDSRGDLIQ